MSIDATVFQDVQAEAQMAALPTYVDDQGCSVLVSDGISRGEEFAVYRRKPNGALSRIKSKYLPPRRTVAVAFEDLRHYARKKGWQPREETPAARQGGQLAGTKG